jgi:hypothetical protein
MTRVKRYRWALGSIGAIMMLALGVLNPLPASASTFAPTNQLLNSLDDGSCLGVQGGSMTNGTQLIMWPCDGSLNQQWTLPNVNNSGSFEIPLQIHNGADYNKCLGALNIGTTDGTPLVIWDCNDHADQLWLGIPVTVTTGGPTIGFMILNNNTSHEVLSIAGATDAPGAPAILWHEVISGDQIWHAGNGRNIPVP